MRVSDLIAADAILVRPRWSNLEEGIHDLVALLVERRGLSRALGDAATHAVLERERADSTAIADIGVSLPHARLAGLPQPVAAMGLSPEGLYESTPGVPIFVVTLILSPAKRVEEHLQLLSACSMLLRSDRARGALLGAADSQTAHAALVAWESFD